jgi:hypothetical protein
MLAICMLCSGSIDDIVVRTDETEGEGYACGEGKREDEGGDEGVCRELFMPLALQCATLCLDLMHTWLSKGDAIRSRKVLPVLPVVVELSPELVPVLCRGKSARAGVAIVVVVALSQTK